MSTNVFIATPMYGGMCSGLYTKSLVKTMRTLLENNIGVQYRDIYNESIVQHARNVLTALFLKSDCHYLLFVDADQSFKDTDVLRMIEEEKDILGGVVPKKRINWKSVQQASISGIPYEQLHKYSGDYNLKLLPENLPPSTYDYSFKVSHIGTGMMLIKRTVFEKMKSITPSFMTDNVGIEGLSSTDIMYEFWAPKILDNVWHSEDAAFCHTWRNMGGDVYAAPWVKTSHVGSYEFSGHLTE